MTGENCSSYTGELVECTRSGLRPGGDLDRHLDTCEFCMDRWEAEMQVTAGLRSIRMRARNRTSSPASRERVMRAFERRHSGVPQLAITLRPRWRMWALGFAAAAMLLIAAGLFAPMRFHSRTHAAVVAGTAVAVESVAADPMGPDAVSTDARDLTNDDFVAVPYAPPLASGELVRIVQADLNPQELITFGFNPGPDWTGDLPAEVVVGEDGYPRAVRISDNSQF